MAEPIIKNLTADVTIDSMPTINPRQQVTGEFANAINNGFKLAINGNYSLIKSQNDVIVDMLSGGVESGKTRLSGVFESTNDSDNDVAFSINFGLVDTIEFDSVEWWEKYLDKTVIFLHTLASNGSNNIILNYTFLTQNETTPLTYTENTGYVTLNLKNCDNEDYATSNLVNYILPIKISDCVIDESDNVSFTAVTSVNKTIDLQANINEHKVDPNAHETEFASKVDKVTGKDLSANDFTDVLKTKLDGIEAGAEVNFTKVSELENDSEFITKTVNNLDNYMPTATIQSTYQAVSAKGQANGYASLDSNGKVPSTQLPSYVDDILEYVNFAGFPATGESGKIYVAKDTDLTYRWSGTVYVEISKSLALGETSSTAYAGDKGKTAYDHSQVATGNPHSVTKTEVGLGNVDNTADADKPISDDTQDALDLKADKTEIPAGFYDFIVDENFSITALNDKIAEASTWGVANKQQARVRVLKTAEAYVEFNIAIKPNVHLTFEVNDMHGGAVITGDATNCIFDFVSANSTNVALSIGISGTNIEIRNANILDKTSVSLINCADIGFYNCVISTSLANDLISFTINSSGQAKNYATFTDCILIKNPSLNYFGGTIESGKSLVITFNNVRDELGNLITTVPNLPERVTVNIADYDLKNAVEYTENKKTDLTSDSDTFYPTVKAVKTALDLKADSKLVRKETILVDLDPFTNQPTYTGTLSDYFQLDNYYFVNITGTDTFKLMTTYDQTGTTINDIEFTLSGLATGNSGTLIQNRCIDFNSNWHMRDGATNLVPIELTPNQILKFKIDFKLTNRIGFFRSVFYNNDTLIKNYFANCKSGITTEYINFGDAIPNTKKFISLNANGEISFDDNKIFVYFDGQSTEADSSDFATGRTFTDRVTQPFTIASFSNTSDFNNINKVAFSGSAPSNLNARIRNGSKVYVEVYNK